MFNSVISYQNRVSRHQRQRRKKRKVSLDIINNVDSCITSSDDDDDIIGNNADHPTNTHEENAQEYGTPEVTQYKHDELLYSDYSNSINNTHISSDDDTDYNEDFVNLSSDSSSPLYENAHISVKAAASRIMSMASEFNFSKNVVERVLKVFKTLLPNPNYLPTTHASIRKSIGAKPSSSSKFYCNSCLQLCVLRSGQKFCDNDKCALVNKSLRNRNISEVVTLDIKQQLKSIVTRNIYLFGNKNLFEPFDISNGEHYKTSITLSNGPNQVSKNFIHSISLNIHTDGAPLIRTTKSSIWPCLASIVELPPQVRENQKNIVILCLWNSSIKPNVDLFMNDCIQQLLDLSTLYTLIVNNLQFSISVRTQLFLADLPAKALFWKTINYNGYNACAHCLTEGIYRNRQLLYPYNKNSYRQRTHTKFLATAQAIDNRILNGSKGGCIDGIKGKSSLLKVFEYPKQIIIDYMHLCCLGHMSSLIQRWLPMLDKDALDYINSKLYSQRFPHNMSVKFNYPLNLCNDWKAKHFRVFILSIGLPYVLTRLPPLFASHFALYSMFIKLLHCPKSIDEIKLADKIIHYYCQTAPQIYGESIELFSLHAHLHLPQQVLMHGTLAEMEQLAKEAEETSTYTMNSDIKSDTEEWHKRKKSLSSKSRNQTNLLNKELSDLHNFDSEGQRTYTTLTSCSFDDFDKTVDCSRISYNKNANDEITSEEEEDDDDEETGKVANHHVLNSTFSHSLASKSKKRTSSRISRKISRKRPRNNITSSSIINQEKTDVNLSSFSILKELSHNLDQLRKQIASLADSYDQHQNTLTLVLNNQKKIAKALRRHKIPIQLLDEMETEASTFTTDRGSVMYAFSNGEKIDLIQIPADKSNPNKFVLKAIEQIFKEPKELVDTDPHSIDTDKRVITIRNAVQVKFGLTPEELTTVWMPMLECIKSKRRNLKAKLKRNMITSNNNSLRSDLGKQSASSEEPNLNNPHANKEL
ncbi:unnamed protein product [Rotaria sordida]|uniref:Transposase n=1 Tax=Rotaria sordida TaxID=392033 RepID=A0A819RM34_9BILA|nr:unnamed protein product [Rotaria sordida]CAF4047185.1 unnamed protein product [Rotaria sordida]